MVPPQNANQARQRLYNWAICEWVPLLYRVGRNPTGQERQERPRFPRVCASCSRSMGTTLTRSHRGLGGLRGRGSGVGPATRLTSDAQAGFSEFGARRADPFFARDCRAVIAGWILVKSFRGWRGVQFCRDDDATSIDLAGIVKKRHRPNATRIRRARQPPVAHNSDFEPNARGPRALLLRYLVIGGLSVVIDVGLLFTFSQHRRRAAEHRDSRGDSW